MTLSRQIILALLLALTASPAMAQTVDTDSLRRKENWAVGGFLTLLAPDIEDYDKNLERYNPPVPMAWFGPSCLNGGLLGDGQADFHLRSGVFQKMDAGFTILQVSRNLYRGVIGLSAGLQLGGFTYSVDRDYSARKDGRRVTFTPSDDEHENENLSFTMLRIPLMIGAQTSNRMFSLQTGLGLCHTTRFGAQWLVTAAVGPFTVNLSQNLTPLFKLHDGTKAYPASLTLGVDIRYWLYRF